MHERLPSKVDVGEDRHTIVFADPEDLVRQQACWSRHVGSREEERIVYLLKLVDLDEVRRVQRF